MIVKGLCLRIDNHFSRGNVLKLLGEAGWGRLERFEQQLIVVVKHVKNPPKLSKK